MVIVAGHLRVDPQQREIYLAGCVPVVAQARRSAGCLDFAISADPVDADRVNIVERWASQAAVDAFRESGPEFEHAALIREAAVAEYDVADARPL
ncbi:antibiotic biosynthesis monooxygenase [Mycolicibacterium duvalii]|uniref:Uncharacterized protein n=1 Tax=Mycolicibacterium duvalii TaxID=39688 RepID=A0A7I7K3H9_9MYCO|nr:antibiotic biosynthesis monooxygenase family protein [Mycolicibacterium duvalii]MCV7367783.1 antibiotic biosynthesis monooxygenase [Mycolicibacterium duvalii]PEG42472.1 antibiotic biosynthesis monooxygenase [Mycolicibacterium duvalii]BBX18627.1 hypothetical protein MDUV_34870 [Mycolicibacterium duvalii]